MAEHPVSDSLIVRIYRGDSEVRRKLTGQVDGIDATRGRVLSPTLANWLRY